MSWKSLNYCIFPQAKTGRDIQPPLHPELAFSPATWAKFGHPITLATGAWSPDLEPDSELTVANLTGVNRD